VSLAPLPLLFLLLQTNPARPVVRPPAPAANPSQDFARGRTAFNRGEYARAIELLRPLLYPETRLESEAEIASAHRMLGVAHLYERQNAEATDEFRKFLQLRPDYRMDRLLDPPMVVDFFNNVLKEQEAELADLERKRRQAQDDERRRLDALRAGPTFVVRNYDRNSLLISFVPFGAGQFQNGHRTKGWFFLGTEAALATVSIGAMATNFALYGVKPTLQCEPSAEAAAGVCPEGFKESPERARSDLLKKVQVASGVLFFATAIWGVTDAVLNFQPRVLIPDDEPPPRRRMAGSANTGPGALRLGLTWMGDGPGGGLAFRF
jgi:hypothetical protein